LLSSTTALFTEGIVAVVVVVGEVEAVALGVEEDEEATVGAGRDGAGRLGAEDDEEEEEEEEAAD